MRLLLVRTGPGPLLSDLCRAESIEFVLGHALYMKAIHGGKTKNDRIDAEKIAMLLRGGMLPGYDIRTVQELLGHKDLRSTMIYTHVLNRGLHVRSPLDR